MGYMYWVFLLISGCQALHSEDEIRRTWLNFQDEFEKSYKSPVEHQKRFSVFKENLVAIELHNHLYNQGKVTYKKGLTKFTDWTSAEFRQYINRFKIPFIRTEDTIDLKTDLTLPTMKDWRDEGAVREVKDQGDCGSCWSFSATGSLEGAAFLTKGLNVSLSEQNLIDCAMNEKYGELGCDGGTMIGAYQYVQDNGITLEESYPYEASQGECKEIEPVLKATGFKYVPTLESLLKSAVASVGPISVGIEATDNLQNYVSGVFYDETCTNEINHGVLAIGYGTENSQDYWLIKNSWGPKWGDAGYFKLARNRNNNCGVASMASYPLV